MSANICRRQTHLRDSARDKVRVPRGNVSPPCCDLTRVICYLMCEKERVRRSSDIELEDEMVQKSKSQIALAWHAPGHCFVRDHHVRDTHLPLTSPQNFSKNTQIFVHDRNKDANNDAGAEGIVQISACQCPRSRAITRCATKEGASDSL